MSNNEIEKIKEKYISLKEEVIRFEAETKKINQRLDKLEKLGDIENTEYRILSSELERKNITDNYLVKESFRDYCNNSTIYVYMGMFRHSFGIDIHRYSDEQVFNIEMADYLLYHNLDYITIEKKLKPIDRNEFEKNNWVLKFPRILLADDGYYQLQYEYHKLLLEGCSNEQKIFQKLKNNIVIPNNYEQTKI